VGIQGTGGAPGTLILRCGEQTVNASQGARVQRWTWAHVCVVKDRRDIRAYLNGELQATVQLPERAEPCGFPWFFGGRSDNDSNWEGRLDEISLFPRALDAAEIRSLLPKRQP
jgi:hypothetical protein